LNPLKKSGAVLHKFITEAKSNYDIAIKDLVYRPGVSPLELVTVETTKKIGQFLAISATYIKKIKTNG
jgi:phytoene desaturase